MYDLIVVGAGPGGTEVALGGAALGWDVALIEAVKIGGTCVNRGCIPTKALLQLREPLLQLEHMESEGFANNTLIEHYRAGLNSPVTLAFRDKQVQASVDGLESQLERAKVTQIEGRGILVASEEGQAAAVQVGDDVYEAKRICLALGSVSAVPPIPGHELLGVYTSDHFLDPTETWPDDMTSVVIVGAGVIGVEMADFFHHLGLNVTLVEMLDRALANLDRGLSRALQQSFKKRGIEIITGRGVDEIREGDSSLEVLVGEDVLPCDAVLMATGRRPATQNFTELELTMDRHFIKVDENFRTSLENVYAIGDCRSGSMLLAHEAMDDGRQLVKIFQGGTRQLKATPSCIYTAPEIAQVGLTEAEAKEQNIEVIAARASTLANARSRMHGSERGYVNLVFANDTKALLGAQWLGDRATELIDELTLAVDLRLTLDELVTSIRPHPSFAETLDQALMAAKDKFGR